MLTLKPITQNCHLSRAISTGRRNSLTFALKMERAMVRRSRIYFTDKQKADIWDRWERGESMSSIGRLFERNSSSIYPLLSRTGGIRPAQRRRSRFALSLPEREEISRGLNIGASLRSIARTLKRAPSTISREVRRNGGLAFYRATDSDKAAWERSLRPKLCKLACNTGLARTVSRLLQRQWSPEQIAGWLKRTYPGDSFNQVSHETIYRSLFVQARGVLRRNYWLICEQHARYAALVMPVSKGLALAK